MNKILIDLFIDYIESELKNVEKIQSVTFDVNCYECKDSTFGIYFTFDKYECFPFLFRVTDYIKLLGVGHSISTDNDFCDFTYTSIHELVRNNKINEIYINKVLIKKIIEIIQTFNLILTEL